jgi:hypothetical protein
MKKKILDRINLMNENELLKIGKDLELPENKTVDDRASVITQDKLSKFNEEKQEEAE